MFKTVSGLAIGLAIIMSGCSQGSGRTPSLIPSPTTPSPAPTIIQPSVPTESSQSHRPTAAPLSGGNQIETPTLPLSTDASTPVGMTPTSEPQAWPADWRELPVIPEINPRVLDIYRRGVALGNNPGAFSKVGDCGSTPAWFLGDFDRAQRYYRLGKYTNLEPIIAAYQGSYSRTSLAAKSGFNASSIFSPLWANPEKCESNESPLACEYRIHRPIAAFIMLGTNDVYHPDEFEPQMRRIIEYSIEQGVIPILSTKADNLEGDGSINATIARLAHEYGVPLLNYWRALQDLPDHGLQEDQSHITWAPNRFDDPDAMQHGWPVRNLTALQTLDTLWRELSKLQPGG